MFDKRFCAGSFFRFESEAFSDEVIEFLRPKFGITETLGRVIDDFFHDQKGSDFAVRWFSFGQFDAGDAQTPNVAFAIVFVLAYDFRRHPIWCPDFRDLFTKTVHQFCAHTEIAQFRVAIVREQNVSGFYVAVDFFLFV
jgi:hypothetical protein